MKNKHSAYVVVLVLAAAVLALPFLSHAADPLQVAPDMYKLLFENEKVRVMQVTFAPGQKVPAHSHPDHFVVVEQPGKIKISKPDGSTNEMELTRDQVVWIPAETHWAENTGKSTVQLVVTEMKGQPQVH